MMRGEFRTSGQGTELLVVNLWHVDIEVDMQETGERKRMSTAAAEASHLELEGLGWRTCQCSVKVIYTMMSSIFELLKQKQTFKTPKTQHNLNHPKKFTDSNLQSWKSR